MIRVRVSQLGSDGAPTDDSAPGEGSTVLRATRDAVRRLTGRCGAITLTRTDSHSWGCEATGLGRYRVTESRSGPSGTTRETQVVSVSLDAASVARLDELSELHGSRSAAVRAMLAPRPRGGRS